MTLKPLLAISAIALLSACTGQVDIPPVALTPQAGVKPLPGKYVAMVQSGGWQLEAKNTGFTCGAWSFNTNVDHAYSDAMKSAIASSLARVDFVDDPLSPKEVEAKGYSGQVVIYQSSASSTFAVTPGLFTGMSNAQMTLSTNIAITGNRGLSNQYNVSSSGVGSLDEIFGCSEAGGSIPFAGQDAIRNLAQNSVMYIRDGFRDLSVK